MKLIVNERGGCCESIQIEYTPVEALIINQAMRRYVCDDKVHEKDRSIMEQMLERIADVLTGKEAGNEVDHRQDTDTGRD